MKRRAIIHCWVLVALIPSCKEPAVRDEFSNKLPVTDQERVVIARSFLMSEQRWTNPEKPISGTGGVRPVSLFSPPPPNPDEELAFRSTVSGNPLVAFVNRYGTTWKAWIAVFDGKSETTVFEGHSLNDCLERIQESYNLEVPLEHIAGD